MPARVLRLVCATVVACTISTTARADVITFEDGNASAVTWVGPGGFFYESFGIGDFPGGTATGFIFTTGPAVLMEPTAGGGVDFTFAEGLLTLTNGTMGFPGFVALATIPVLPFSVSLSPQDHEPINNTVWPDGTLVSTYLDVDVTLGPGQLDPALAASLGVSRFTVGGSMEVIVDDPWLNSSTDCPEAPADSYCGLRNDFHGSIDTVPVPEPALLALLALGVGMSTPLIARRARSRRRT